jgi:tryptophan synthase alpha chain
MSTKIFSGSKRPLIAYLMAGYPTLEKSFEAAQAVLEAGADALELGVPFSDPIADGPVIQKASTVALRQRVSLRQALGLSARLGGLGKPIYIMSYLNPILRMGYSVFAEAAGDSGVSGVIIPDLPVDLAGEWVEEAWPRGLETVFLATPATSTDRLRLIAEKSTGFVYLVSVYGVTGPRQELPDYTYEFIRRAKRTVSKPVALGFGVSNPKTVADAVRAGADGIIVGSLFISVMDQGDWANALGLLKATVSQLKSAADAV